MERNQNRLDITLELIELTGLALYPEQLSIYKHLSTRLKGKKILEVGCGIGLGAALLSKHNIVLATDRLQSNIRLAKAFYPWMYFDVLNIAKSDCAGFDVTVCIDVIEHIKDYKQAMKNLVESAGEVWISTPNRNNPGIGQERSHNSFHVKEFTPEEMFEMIGKQVKVYRWDTFEEVDESTIVTPLVYQI